MHLETETCLRYLQLDTRTGAKISGYFDVFKLSCLERRSRIWNGNRSYHNTRIQL